MNLTGEAASLWSGAPKPRSVFSPELVRRLPEPAQRYFLHAIAPGAPLAEAVRLRMHGHIRLNGTYYPFEGTQVSVWHSGFRWDAHVKLRGLPVTGFDRLRDGAAEMRWKLLGVIPMVQAGGPDVTRSALGRMMAEAVWLPAVLLRSDVEFREASAQSASATLRLGGESASLRLDIDASGALRSLQLERWGSLSGEPARYHAFGGYVDAERSFGGVTIPTKLRIGWHFGSERFERDGEFFRVEIDEAEHVS
jgi:hypothetical protein